MFYRFPFTISSMFCQFQTSQIKSPASSFICVLFNLILFTGEAVTEEVELQLPENVIMGSVYASVSVLGNHNEIPSNLSGAVQPVGSMHCNLWGYAVTQKILLKKCIALSIFLDCCPFKHSIWTKPWTWDISSLTWGKSICRLNSWTW